MPPASASQRWSSKRLVVQHRHARLDAGREVVGLQEVADRALERLTRLCAAARSARVCRLIDPITVDMTNEI